VQGVESRRRDTCPIVTATMDEVLKSLFPVRDNLAAVISDNDRKAIVSTLKEYVIDVVAKITKGEHHLGMFVVTKGQPYDV
jgi:DNA polymerase elongation subunit (family B)